MATVFSAADELSWQIHICVYIHTIAPSHVKDIILVKHWPAFDILANTAGAEWLDVGCIWLNIKYVHVRYIRARAS